MMWPVSSFPFLGTFMPNLFISFLMDRTKSRWVVAFKFSEGFFEFFFITLVKL